MGIALENGVFCIKFASLGCFNLMFVLRVSGFGFKDWSIDERLHFWGNYMHAFVECSFSTFF